MVAFFSAPSALTAVFLMLLLLSVTAFFKAWTTDLRQRGGRNAGIWLLRVLVGSMWWQQSLLNVPPNSGGLIHWLQEMVEHSAIPSQGDLVQTIVLPRISVFGPLIYGIEVAIGVSLILGLFTRLGAVLGLLIGLNLWLGLYSAPGEWPWTYGFLIIIQGIYVLDPPGRSLGVDAMLRMRRLLPDFLG
jgi:uncharacterized membrane protein YphA (DoxX/SURF4 family)